jgi:hypothetical protein
MYIIVNYHLINFNLDEAQTAYTELVEVYDEESGFSPVLTAIYGEDLSALEKRMLATLESAKQLENNMIYYN